MTGDFTDKAILVTGGGTGIGAGVALAFAREGATVVVAGRTRDRLDSTVKLIRDHGYTAHAVTADVRDEDDAAALVAATVEYCGVLDVAFNNAGIVTRGSVADIDKAEWDDTLAVNLTGILLCMKNEIRAMRETGGGAIVNMASTIGVHCTRPGMGAYTASKAAVSALTRVAALENIGDGVRINCVSPGPVDAPMSLRPGETVGGRAARLAGSIPVGRAGTLEEIAAAVLWLAGPTAGFVVGQDVVLDGGAAL